MCICIHTCAYVYFYAYHCISHIFVIYAYMCVPCLLLNTTIWGAQSPCFKGSIRKKQEPVNSLDDCKAQVHCFLLNMNEVSLQKWPFTSLPQTPTRYIYINTDTIINHQLVTFNITHFWFKPRMVHSVVHPSLLLVGFVWKYIGSKSFVFRHTHVIDVAYISC